uniref:1-phosphatidylinositol-3-phosphate 5-kinase n=1 Tax=Culex tarsalis TaxID=7177 RepID=A0A1Q3G2X3_CULTA
MNRNLHSATVLTEFARFDADESESMLTKFVNKLTVGFYNSGSKEIHSSTDDTHPTTDIDVTNDNCAELHEHDKPCKHDQLSQHSPKRSPSVSSRGSHSEVIKIQGRNSVNVLERLRNLVSQKSTNAQLYKHTELQKFWMPDSTSIECYDCSVKFSTFRRKHHCRLCGQIFCIKCCNQVVPGKIINCTGDLKVCTYCSKVILTYLKSLNTTTEIKSDFRALQEDLSNKLSVISQHTNDSSANNQQRRKVSVGYQEERFISSNSRTMSTGDRKSMLQQSSSLRSIYDEMIKVLPGQNHGFELLAYLFSSQKSSNNRQAIAILNAMVEAGFIISEKKSENDNINIPDEFDESIVYTFIEPDEMYDMLSDSNSLQHRRSAAHENSFDIIPPSSPETGYLTSDQRMEIEDPLLSSSGAKALLQAFCEHEETMLHQLLSKENLDPSWAKILIPIAARVANTVRPQICGSVDSIDIRNHVFLKKIPGGQRQECKSVGGVVFTKNVVHRQMMSHIEKPKILLLQCGIAYQRVEGKFVSFDTLMLQERDYLRNKITKILSLGPNIVLVHKNVAGIAQDMLRSKGITLVLDVKLCVMERISRCFECDILTSIDSNVGQPKLGTCDKFYIKTFYDEQGSSKTMMCFVKSYSPRGCCVLLRGGAKSELIKIKKVMSLLLYARFNWRLELSYLYDACAQPPSPRSCIFEGEELSPLEETKSSTTRLNTALYKHTNEKQKIKMMNMEDVDTFSDPLRAALTEVTDQENEYQLVVENPFDDRFRNALTSTVLSISPFMNFPPPYLETDKGRKCELRRYFPEELYYSKQWCNPTYEQNINETLYAHAQNDVEISSLHKFTSYRMISTVDHKDVQIMLASYRATGGRYIKQADMKDKSKNVVEGGKSEQKVIDEYIYEDALDLVNHQRLPVLFCSFYDNPSAPSFCAEPSFLNMQFYGHNDIMLGEFLERYCFRSSYICKSCNLPMMDHVRRYVHSQGCVHVELHEDMKKVDTGTILITSKCTLCNEATLPAPMSTDTWCYSLAKYLELRFHGHFYKRRTLEKQKECNHSLHRDHVQYFSYKGIVASFRYSSIEIWEVGLPTICTLMQLKDLKVKNTQQDIEDIKNFALKGYEVYVKIFDRLADLTVDTETSTKLKKKANQDQMNFKQRLDFVQTLLVDSESTSEEIEDAILFLKKALAEAVDEWEPRLNEMMIQCKSNPSNTMIDNTAEEIDPTSTVKKDENKRPAAEKTNFMSRLTSSESDVAEFVAESSKMEDKNVKESDRKGVKGLLSQLLSSSENAHIFDSPLPNYEHHNLKCGLFPVIVNDQDLSSCIAYSLVCSDYLKSLDNLYVENVAESSPHLKRKSSDIGFTSESEDSDKKSKCSSHIEVNFQDSSTSFTCKVFFAKEFDSLRNTFLKTPSIEGKLSSSKSDDKTKKAKKLDGGTNSIRHLFARSLSKSVRWQAQGGKSGSKFSKTMDDRFVLKEMSRTDLSIFEHFATNYFDYLQQCLQKKQPTLLAKIYGVFKVVVRKKDNTTQETSVLIMENLFCDRNITEKFDLKGSLRNRMVNPNRQSGEIVLMDENLMQMSWTNPIYILTHSSIVLKEVIDRDASFLEKQGVMDYSLLVGFDRSVQLLVVGIIDYIRTFTLDKRVESIIKQSGIMGGHGKLPTVISPKMYKTRFSEAMDRYFLSVPDHWEGLSKYCCPNYMSFEQNKDKSK